MQQVRVDEAFQQGLINRGFLYRDGRTVHSINEHPSGRGYYSVALGQSRDARADTISLFAASRLDYVPDKTYAGDTTEIQRLRAALEKIASQEEANISGDTCVLCGAVEFAVDEDGNRVSRGDEEAIESIHDFAIEHREDCPFRIAIEVLEITKK